MNVRKSLYPALSATLLITAGLSLPPGKYQVTIADMFRLFLDKFFHTVRMTSENHQLFETIFLDSGCRASWLRPSL